MNTTNHCRSDGYRSNGSTDNTRIRKVVAAGILRSGISDGVVNERRRSGAHVSAKMPGQAKGFRPLHGT